MKYLLICMTALMALTNLQAQDKFADRVSKIGAADLTLIDLAAGDTLIYEVNTGAAPYNFILVLKTFDPTDKGIAFDWEMTDPVSLSGSVKIMADAFLNSRSYINRFAGGPLVLKNACTVFMTSANFADMPGKESKLTLDGSEETFYRPDSDEVPFNVKIGGQDYVLDGFKINNKKDGSGDKTIVIQGISSNPLILQMDLGFSIRLKEIK